MNCTITVVTRLSLTKVHSTFINIDPSIDEPYVMGVSQYGPPFLVTGQPKIPEQIGDTEITIDNHNEDGK